MNHGGPRRARVNSGSYRAGRPAARHGAAGVGTFLESAAVPEGQNVSNRKSVPIVGWGHGSGRTRAESSGDEGGPPVLPIAPAASRRSPKHGGTQPEIPLERILRDVEAALIRISLHRATSVDVAARRLGLTPEALSLKMRRLGVTLPAE